MPPGKKLTFSGLFDDYLYLIKSEIRKEYPDAIIVNGIT